MKVISRTSTLKTEERINLEHVEREDCLWRPVSHEKKSAGRHERGMGRDEGQREENPGGLRLHAHWNAAFGEIREESGTYGIAARFPNWTNSWEGVITLI